MRNRRGTLRPSRRRRLRERLWRRAAAADAIATIERLAELRDRGILTDDEFARKKADLLDRL